MFDQAQTELATLRDLLRFAVSRFNEAQLFFGHGSDNAWDEAAYLLLHTLHLPLDRLEPFLDARLTSAERAGLLRIIERRIGERLPVAYLTNEAWLGEYRFYVDQRVIVPRSFIAELLRERPKLVSVMLANNETGVVQPVAGPFRSPTLSGFRVRDLGGGMLQLSAGPAGIPGIFESLVVRTDAGR